MIPITQSQHEDTRHDILKSFYITLIVVFVIESVSVSVCFCDQCTFFSENCSVNFQPKNFVDMAFEYKVANKFVFFFTTSNLQIIKFLSKSWYQTLYYHILGLIFLDAIDRHTLLRETNRRCLESPS